MDNVSCCAGAEGALPPEILEQLSLVNNSQKLLIPIIVSLLIQYKSLDAQRALLLDSALKPGSCCTGRCPDPKAMQLTASLLTLSSLFGYQKQTEGIRNQLAAQNGCADNTDVTLGMMILLIALIRFLRLLDSGANGGDETQELEAIEAEGVEVV